MTGSAKTGHNHTSLNLQYKTLNTLGACLRINPKLHSQRNYRFSVQEESHSSPLARKTFSKNQSTLLLEMKPFNYGVAQMVI